MSDEIRVKSNVEKLELYSDNHPFRLSLRVRNFESESEYKKFLKNCERAVRGSIEYKLWRNYIIDVLQIQTCSLTQERMDEVSIEIHHHISSLFILVTALVNKKIELEQEFCTFDIAQEAIELHFMNKVGYVPLIRDLHSKFHNGFLQIPIESVKGDYRYFIREYSKYLEEEDLDVINQRLSVTESNCNWSRDDYPGELVANG